MFFAPYGPLTLPSPPRRGRGIQRTSSCCTLLLDPSPPIGGEGRVRGSGSGFMITNRPLRNLSVALALAAALLVPVTARAEIQLPPGFTVKVYVTGEGFETTGGPGGRGIPTTPTLAVDPTGALYLARGGRRYSAGEFDYLQRMYRIPPGGARVTPATEERYFHGPPLINAQVMGARGGRELLVSTF